MIRKTILCLSLDESVKIAKIELLIKKMVIKQDFEDEIAKLEQSLDLNSRALEEEIETNKILHQKEHRAIQDEIEFFRSRREEDLVHNHHSINMIQMQVSENEQMVHGCMDQLNSISEDLSKRMSALNFRMSSRLRAVDASTHEITEADEHLQEGHLETSFTLFPMNV